MRLIVFLIAVITFSSCEPLGRFTDDNFDYEYHCTVPVSLSATASGTEVTLNWVASGIGQVLFDVEYGLFGFDQGSGTTVSTQDFTITLTDLDESRKYDFYIRSNCSDGEISQWVKSDFRTD